MALTSLVTAVLMAPVYVSAPQSYRAMFPANPFEPRVNDVRLVLFRDRERVADSPATFAGDAWQARAVAPQPGRYRIEWWRNGTRFDDGVKPIVITEDNLFRPFQAKENRGGTLFHRNETTFTPMGADWHGATPRLSAVPDANWVRLVCSDGSEFSPLREPDGHPIRPGYLSDEAIERIDAYLDEALRHGKVVQLALWDARDFLPNRWPRHPWNADNGGFLTNAADLFTEPEPIRRMRLWARYAALRWSAHPALFAIEPLAYPERIPQASVWIEALVEEIRRSHLVPVMIVGSGEGPYDARFGRDAGWRWTRWEQDHPWRDWATTGYPPILRDGWLLGSRLDNLRLMTMVRIEYFLASGDRTGGTSWNVNGSTGFGESNWGVVASSPETRHIDGVGLADGEYDIRIVRSGSLELEARRIEIRDFSFAWPDGAIFVALRRTPATTP